jgi:hypothetical protein
MVITLEQTIKLRFLQKLDVQSDVNGSSHSLTCPVLNLVMIQIRLCWIFWKIC